MGGERDNESYNIVTESSIVTYLYATFVVYEKGGKVTMELSAAYLY